MSIACHHCGGAKFRKNGSSQGIQRYICGECGRSFTNKQPKFDRATKEKALHMYLNNVGIRKIALFVGASPPAVLKWIKKAGEALSERLSDAATQLTHELPDVIEMDEIYTYIQKNSAAQSSGLLILGGKIALLRLK